MRSLPVVDRDMDGLRLAALGRIERCKGCPRYSALVSVYRAAGPGAPRTRLPEVPRNCGFAACAPLASRYGLSDGAAPSARPRAASALSVSRAPVVQAS